MANPRLRPQEASGEEIVAGYVSRLVAAGADSRAFDAVFDALQGDKCVKLVHVIAIAQRYAKVRERPPTKTLALAAISKRFVETVRAGFARSCERSGSSP